MFSRLKQRLLNRERPLQTRPKQLRQQRSRKVPPPLRRRRIYPQNLPADPRLRLPANRVRKARKNLLPRRPDAPVEIKLCPTGHSAAPVPCAPGLSGSPRMADLFCGCLPAAPRSSRLILNKTNSLLAAIAARTWVAMRCLLRRLNLSRIFFLTISHGPGNRDWLPSLTGKRRFPSQNFFKKKLA